jgi:RimJ/RimL family protein N-acetyltransferase
MDTDNRQVSSPTSTSIGSNVKLRDVEEVDLQFFYRFQLDPESNRFIGLAPRDESESYAHWAKILADVDGIHQTIVADGEVAGNIVCFLLGGEREVGYRLGREYWGKGIATKALAQFLTKVSERPLHAHVAKRNVASIRVLEKCGFAVIGEDQMSSEITGEVIEEYVMSLQ